MIAPCKFLLGKIEMSLPFNENGCSNWREKERNMCSLKHVEIINHMNKTDILDHLSLSKTTSAKKERRRTETAVSLSLH